MSLSFGKETCTLGLLTEEHAKEKVGRMVPFHIQVAEEILIDLRERLARTRWPDELPDAGRDYGTNRAYLQQLVTYWREQYDWRAQERLLNTFPQFQTEVDGIRLHFVHTKGQGTHPLPLLISHGWPGSFFEMYKIIGPLTGVFPEFREHCLSAQNKSL